MAKKYHAPFLTDKSTTTKMTAAQNNQSLKELLSTGAIQEPEFIAAILEWSAWKLEANQDTVSLIFNGQEAGQIHLHPELLMKYKNSIPCSHQNKS